MNRIIINPFEKIAEKNLLILGFAIAIGGSLLGHLFNTRFTGVIDVQAQSNVSIALPFIENAINTISLCLPLFILGRVINNKTRFIDVLNVALICRSPFYLLTLGNISGFMKNLELKIAKNPFNTDFSAIEITIVSFYAILGITCLVWFVALAYNGFKTATNLKRTPHKVAFAFTIIFAEAVASTLIYFIN